MEIDPFSAKANDELEFIELPGINDDALDQLLAGLIRDLRNNVPDTKSVSQTVLMLVAQQLPIQLEFRFNHTSELEDVAHERLLGLLDDAIQSGKYYKLRRLDLVLRRSRGLSVQVPGRPCRADWQ